jgi:hypothetical protein
MAISADILDRNETHFVLWRRGMTAIKMLALVIGTQNRFCLRLAGY